MQGVAVQSAFPEAEMRFADLIAGRPLRCNPRATQVSIGFSDHPITRPLFPCPPVA